MTTRVLILEAGGPESRAIVQTAVRSGYQVHAATTSPIHATYGAELKALLSGCLLTDFDRPDQALRDIVAHVRNQDVNAVFTTNEYLTELLAHVCADLGLPGNDPALAAAARDKAAMYGAFTAAGVTTPYSRLVSSEDELRALCAAGSIAFPCVIKPVDGAGSAGVTVLANSAQVPAAWRAAHASHGMYGTSCDAHVLVQDYVVGAEYSVESITQRSITTHLCITEKAVTSGAHRVETGHSLPAALPPIAEQNVHREVEKAIAAVGIRNGASHTEVIVGTDGRCTVIEIGARIGAGQIGFLIQYALGIDPWAACLDTAMGRAADLTPTSNGYATVRFLTSPHRGRIAAMTGLPERGPRVPIVRMRAETGQAVCRAERNATRLGSFVVVGPNRDTVSPYADHLLAQIRIEVEPVEPTDSHATSRESDSASSSSHADHR
ncbi:ATP-grasp domain-containing protein [Streptomyces sp. NPDC001815]|uniref:ATP-grasp domain-containing protein n=1 Tax=Streptomyces sp. NPDC001815 TaxID=3154526 RepID=UPI00331ED016